MSLDDVVILTDQSTLFAAPGGESFGLAFAQTAPDWGHYKVGYEQAVELLLDRLENGTDDFLAYPLFFCARQTVELGLKDLARLLMTSDKDNKPKIKLNHDLTELWRYAKGLLDGCLPGWESGRVQLDGFETLLNEFAQLDPHSSTFRYPENKSGEATYVMDWVDAADGDGDSALPPIIGIKNLRSQLSAMFLFVDALHDWTECQLSQAS